MKVVAYQHTFFDSLLNCFNEAFSKNKVKLQLSPHDFRIRLYHKLHLDPNLSRLIVLNDQVVGFALFAAHENLKQGYNGGTGVLPKCQKQGFGDLLMTECLAAFQKKKIQTLWLEVLEDNTAALTLYDKHGFVPTRKLLCFRRDKIKSGAVRNDLEIRPATQWQRAKYEAFSNYENAFIDRFPHLVHNKNHELVLEAYSGDLVGFIIFQPHIGRISQLAVIEGHRREKVASTLVYHAQRYCPSLPLTVMNVPEGRKDMTGFLESRGFQNQISQIEMKKELRHVS